MPIQAIHDYAEMVRAGNGTADARLRLLEEHRSRVIANLREQRAHLEAITQKIAAYHIQPADETP